MKVIICGAGQVGFGIAEKLAAEQNDVTVIDSSAELIHTITDAFDLKGIVGHGSHPEVLQLAGAEETDMIIAVTFSDEVNMVACQVAHSLFDIPIKVARVRAQSYLAPGWQDLYSRDNMPIDVIISPEVAVGDMVLRRLAQPGAFETISFVDDRISVVGVTCEDECAIINTPLRQLTELFPGLASVVIGIVRGGRLFIPHSGDQMLAGDDVYFAAAPDQVGRTLSIFGHDEEQARRIIIAGGGNIGFYVADQLEKQQSRTKVKIIEPRRKRAEEIADRLKRAVVLNGSALNQDLLREAGASEAETFVSLTNDDQVNILASVMAKHEGCKRTLSLVSNQDYVGIVRSLGIDAHVSPKALTISTILQHVRRGSIRRVHAVQNGAGEIVEAEALETSPLVGKPLREVGIPDGMRVGAVVRDGVIIMPDGNTEVRAHDRVVMFTLAGRIREVEKMFRVSLEYF